MIPRRKERAFGGGKREEYFLVKEGATEHEEPK